MDKRKYVPPRYIPLGQSDSEEADLQPIRDTIHGKQHQEISASPEQWSSGICACFDDVESCCIGLVCPCYLFGKNTEFSGSGILMGSCLMHFILWGLVNSLCCALTDGCMLALPGCLVAFYACGHRRTIRSKYNLQEAPCGDFTTHFFCHLCAICQEYREIRARSPESNVTSLNVVTAPSIQIMESASSTDVQKSESLSTF